ncbi:MAG TPA: SRPBCC domain-containing protein [Candidatus Angelobacter sp.]|nr:SRPBCC domain-containing protein [Candidatus Angelobacter sp.]
MPAQGNPAQIPKTEIEVTRVINAERAMVFEAWTDPKQLAAWWGPRGFSSPVCRADARPGGEIYIEMRGPDGVVYPMKGTFQEVVPPERIVFVSAALDKDGKALFEVLNTATFTEQGKKTTLTLHARVLTKTPLADQYLAGMEIGWRQSLDRLAEFNETGRISG